MRQCGTMGLAMGVIAVGALMAPGCATRRTTPPVIHNDGPERLQSALRLAERAEDAWKSGKTDVAIDLYRQSLEQSQELPVVWNNLGTLLMKQHNYYDAATAFQHAADLSPKDPVPYNNLGLVYQDLGREEQALEYFVKALERNPRYLPSLRGAVFATKRLVLSDSAALNRVRMALLLETDPQWRSIMQVEQIRIENDLKGKPGG